MAGIPAARGVVDEPVLALLDVQVSAGGGHPKTGDALDRHVVDPRLNLDGGLAAWSETVDPSFPRY